MIEVYYINANNPFWESPLSEVFNYQSKYIAKYFPLLKKVETISPESLLAIAQELPGEWHLCYQSKEDRYPAVYNAQCAFHMEENLVCLEPADFRLENLPENCSFLDILNCSTTKFFVNSYMQYRRYIKGGDGWHIDAVPISTIACNSLREAELRHAELYHSPSGRSGLSVVYIQGECTQSTHRPCH